MFKFNKKNKAEAPDRATGTGQGAESQAAQGISAKGNALRTICSVALLVVLLPTALGFAFLLMLREPALQQHQVERIADGFAIQQATNIERILARLRERLQSAARSPLALSAIASRSREDIELVEKTMLDYFPEVISLRIIPVGEMGTASFRDGKHGLRNLIEIDMVRLASEGKDTGPQSYQFEDRWISSLAERVTSPRNPDDKAVILITIDNTYIGTQLQSLDTEAGKFALEQQYESPTGKRKTNIIASSGSGIAGDNTSYADIPDSEWRIAFSPSQALLDELNVSPIPGLVVLALIVAGALGAIAIVLLRVPRSLEGEVTRLISAADRKTSLTLSVPELVPVAKQLRRATLRALRQSNTEIPRAEVEELDSLAGDSPGDMSNPMFQQDTMLDEHEEELDLDLAADISLPGKGKGTGLPAHIFRAYDIRGLADKELTDEVIDKVGRAIGSIAGERGEQTVIVGCDGRKSSPRIKSALVKALMGTGREVIDIGLVPTPLLYFATRRLDCHSGVMVTGSHNPADHNGLKIVLNQETIAAGGISEIRDRAASGNFATGNGRLVREDIVSAYTEAVTMDIAIAVPLKIVIDAGNGATSDIAPGLFEELGCEVIGMNCTVDGNFPGHPPDTSNEANLAPLCRKVLESQADFGVAFDGDGDRLAVVTPDGAIVRSDTLLMLYAQDVVSRNPGADVVFDVKCSHHLSSVITRNGGRPVLWKTGHAFMKEKMRETGALLGGEFSGHMFFGERWFGFDDGMYAAARLAEILSTHGESLSDCVAAFPVTVSTPEILIPVADDYKFELVDKIVNKADFSSGKVNTMDGIRVDFSNGWGLVRASNTGPALTARFEADTEENLAIIQEEFRAQIALIDPEIELGF